MEMKPSLFALHKDFITMLMLVNSLAMVIAAQAMGSSSIDMFKAMDRDTLLNSGGTSQLYSTHIAYLANLALALPMAGLLVCASVVVALFFCTEVFSVEPHYLVLCIVYLATTVLTFVGVFYNYTFLMRLWMGNQVRYIGLKLKDSTPWSVYNAYTPVETQIILDALEVNLNNASSYSAVRVSDVEGSEFMCEGLVGSCSSDWDKRFSEEDLTATYVLVVVMAGTAVTTAAYILFVKLYRGEQKMLVADAV
jgi:hypothetical protein